MGCRARPFSLVADVVDDGPAHIALQLECHVGDWVAVEVRRIELIGVLVLAVIRRTVLIRNVDEVHLARRPEHVLDDSVSERRFITC